MAWKIVEFSANPVLDLINYIEVLLFCDLTGNVDVLPPFFSLEKDKSSTLTSTYTSYRLS